MIRTAPWTKPSWILLLGWRLAYPDGELDGAVVDVHDLHLEVDANCGGVVRLEFVVGEAGEDARLARSAVADQQHFERDRGRRVGALHGACFCWPAARRAPKDGIAAACVVLEVLSVIDAQEH